MQAGIPIALVLAALTVLTWCWHRFAEAEKQADLDWADHWLDTDPKQPDWTQADTYQLREDQIDHSHKDHI